MAEAWVAGRAASLDEATAAAAKILAASRCPVIAGLGTDVAGAEAAVALARRIGGALDHMHAAPALGELEIMRSSGWIVASMPQARVLADVVLLVGAVSAPTWAVLADWLRLAAPPSLAPDAPRRVIRLCPGRDGASPASGAAVETVGAGPEELPALLGALRALLAGRRIGDLGAAAQPVVAAAEALRAARYGVAVWSACELDPLSIEMLCGLIDDLNLRTRFAGLPLPPDDNAAGVIEAAAWRTGFPVRLGFGRGKPEHDPWRFDAARMVESGEADAAVWISACSAEAPPWHGRVPLIALVADRSGFVSPSEVAIEVGRPGVDHDAVLFDSYLGVLAAKTAAAPREAPSVAEIIDRIAEQLPAVPTSGAPLSGAPLC